MSIAEIVRPWADWQSDFACIDLYNSDPDGSMGGIEVEVSDQPKRVD